MRNVFARTVKKVTLLLSLVTIFLLGMSQQADAGITDIPTTNDSVEHLEKTNRSPVIVDGEVLFFVRGASSLPSQQRAENIAERIINVAKDSRFNPEQLKVVPNEVAVSIYAGNLMLVSILDADSKYEDLDRATLAKIHLSRISQAIHDYRTYRSFDYLIQSGTKILVASIILLIFIFSFKWILKRSIAYTGLVINNRLIALETTTYSLLRANKLLELLITTLRLIWWVIILFAFNVYLTYTLGMLPWARPFVTKTIHIILIPLRRLMDAFFEALPGLVFIAILVILLRYILGLMKLLLINVASRRISWQGFEPEWAVPTYRIVRIFIIVFGLVVAYPYIPGSDTEAFKGVSILLGLLVSVGSTSIIGNIIAGYSLIYRQAFKIGDWIKVGENLGEVIKISTLVTNLRTFKNEVVVVPNSEVLNSCVINFSTIKTEDKLILHTTVGIGYETPWRQVDVMLKMAAEKTSGLLMEPKPFVLQKSLGDFCVVYEINAYTQAPESMPKIYSELHQNIQDVFNEYGVQIMTPAYMADPEKPKVVSKNDWYADPANLTTGGET